MPAGAHSVKKPSQHSLIIITTFAYIFSVSGGSAAALKTINNMTIRIPDGNAFRIRLTARNLISGEYTEAADLSNIDNLVINYVRRGIRFPHAYTIDEEGRATVADAGTLDCGFYGIELTGYYGGEKFRFYGKDLFEITTDTTNVIDPSNLIDIEITVKLNASGVSKDYVDHAINGMETSMETMQADLRDEIAEAGKVDDVKVNGVSVVSGKKAIITVPTKVSDLNNDLGYQNEQQVQQKVDAAKITSADISVDGGTGTPSGSAGVSGNQLVIALHNIKGEKGDPGDTGATGPTGPQGATSVYDKTTQDFLTTLETTTGQSQTKTMTQKAVTDAICGINLLGNSRFFTAFQIATSNASTTWYATNLGLEKGKKYRIRVRASASYNKYTTIILQIASQQYEGQKSIFEMPAGDTSAEADYFCDDDTLQYMAIYASGGHTVTYNISIVEYIELADNLPTLHQANYVDYFFSLSNYKASIGNSTKSICISAVGGEKMLVKAGIDNTQMAFLTSLPTLSNNIDLSTYVIGVKTILAGDEEYVTIPQGTTIVWINLSTYTSGSLHVFAPEYYKFVEGDGYGISAKNNSVSISDEIESSLFVEKNAFLSLSNKKFAVSDNNKGKYIRVKKGECYRIVADKGHNAQVATMKSIAGSIANMDDSTAIRCIWIPQGSESFVQINEGENVLWMNVQTYYDGSTIYFDGSIYYAVDTSQEIGGKPIVLIPIYGQSLAIGGGTTRLTTKAKYPSITFNTEGIYNVYSGDNVETSKEGLLDSLVGNFCKDSHVKLSDVGTTVVSFSYGQGSTSITGLKKGTTLYSNFLAKIQKVSDASDSNLVVPAFCWVQGEEDRFDTNTNDYKGELAQLREDLDEDIKAITGQTEDVHCIVYQTNQLSIGGSHFIPTNYESGMGGALMSVPQAQYELIRDSHYFHASTPIYMMAFYLSQNGYRIHITNESQRLLGYYEGLQAERLLERGADIGLYVTSVTKVDSTHIKLNVHTPCPPLVIDTEQVYEVAGYGFSVITSNNENILQGVSISSNHFSEQAIIIETSADCSGAKVRYGVNGTVAIDSSGYQNGSRGNIRDSQGLVYIADINGKKVPMHNWLYFFEEIIK